jgi:hypothetical protein
MTRMPQLIGAFLIEPQANSKKKKDRILRYRVIAAHAHDSNAFTQVLYYCFTTALLLRFTAALLLLYCC